MRVFDGLDDFARSLGTHLGHSEWHTVTQELINTFADATGDHQWIHVDPERAAAGPYGAPVAHGYLILSLIPMLAWQIFTVTGVTMTVNYGLNRVRFPAPVPAGSRIRASAELIGLEPRPPGVLATIRVSLEREGTDRPVCVAETLSLMVP